VLIVACGFRFAFEKKACPHRIKRGIPFVSFARPPAKGGCRYGIRFFFLPSLCERLPPKAKTAKRGPPSVFGSKRACEKNGSALGGGTFSAVRRQKGSDFSKKGR